METYSVKQKKLKASEFQKQQGMFEILMITLVSSQKPVFPNISACSVHKPVLWATREESIFEL